MTENALGTDGQHRHRHRLRRTVATTILFVALLLAVGGGTAAAQTDINGCTQINSAGSYEITQEIGDVSAACINVAAADVAIDGNGNRINSTLAGVLVSPPSGQDGIGNVTVENLTVTNSFAGIDVRSAEDVEVTDVVTSNTVGGMSFENTTDVNVEGVSVELTGLGVRVNGSENVTVRDSRVTSEELFFLPPDFDPGDLPDDPFTGTLDDSTLETQSHTGDETGIFFNNTIDGKIVDNTVTQFDGPGIEVVSSGPSFDFPIDDLPDDPITLSDGVSPAQVSPNTVVDNDLTDNAEGIAIEDSFLYGVDNNTVTNSTDDGISLSSSSSVSLTDNEVSESGDNGIRLTEADNNELRDNTVTENDDTGIYLNGTSTGNEIAENTANDNGQAGGGGPGFGTYGIWLEDGSNDNEIIDNEAFDNGIGGGSGAQSAGIYLGGAGGGAPIGPIAPVENNTVVDNTAGSSQSGSQDYGIWLAGANKNELRDNVAENNDEAGVYLGGNVGSTGTTDNTLVNNTARGSEYGIWLKNAFNNDVSESLAENNEEGIAVEEEQALLSEDVETEYVDQTGNTFTDDVSRNNDWDFVVDSLDLGPISLSSTASDFPVTNLSIGASTAPGTTLSFDADDVRVGSVDSPEPNPDAENISRYFEAEAVTTGVNPFLNVSLSYDDADVSGVNESTLELLRFDDGPSEWLPTGSTMDEQNNTVSVNTTTFSDFGVFGAESSGSLSPDNPFGDANNEPLGISDAADVLFEWNQPPEEEVNGRQIPISDMADFLFQWNQARS